MDEVISSQKDQLVSKERSLVNVALSTSVNSRYAETSDFCVRNVEPAVVIKHVQYFLVEDQVPSGVFTELSGGEELPSQCLSHDLAQSVGSIPCLGQDLLVCKPCLVSSEGTRHADSHQVSNKSSCLTESHREAATAHRKNIKVISLEDGVVNHVSGTTSHSRNNFRTCCSNEAACSIKAGSYEASNEQTRHLSNNRSEAGLHNQANFTVTNACHKRDGLNRSNSARDETNKYKTSNQSFQQSDVNHSDQGMPVSCSSMQQTAVDNVRQHHLGSLNDLSQNVCSSHLSFVRSFLQVQLENKAVEQTILTVGIDEANSGLLPGQCEGVDGVCQRVEDGNALADISGADLSGLLPGQCEGVDGVCQRLEDGNALADISGADLSGREHQGDLLSLTEKSLLTQDSLNTQESMFCSTECQQSSVLLTKNDPVTDNSTITSQAMYLIPECQDSLTQTSLIKPEIISDSLFVPASLSCGSEGGRSSLTHPRQNQVAGHSNHSTDSTENLCKVVTKYVFINKSLKSNTGKKRFGILYRQAFRHFHGAKLQIRKQKKIKKLSVVKEKIKKKVPSNRTTLPRKKSVAFNKEVYLRNQNRETRNKSREERILARELRKGLNKDVNKDVIESRNEEKKILKDRKQEVTDECNGKVVSIGGKQRLNSQKLQNLEDTTSRIQATGRIELTQNVIKNESRATRQLWRKQTKEVPVVASDTSSDSKKRRKQTKEVPVVASDTSSDSNKTRKQRRINVEKEDIEVKEDIIGREIQVTRNDVGAGEPCQQKMKLRNRKDLTLQEKMQAVRALDVPGSKFVTVAKRFGVSVSAISRINKNRDLIMLQAVSGDLNRTQRRSRECKDPQLDKGLLRWYRTIEQVYSHEGSVAISNVLLKEKAHELAVALGRNYFPSDNWIIRWKNRHNIRVKSSSTISSREELRQLDLQVDLADVLQDLGQAGSQGGSQESLIEPAKKPDDMFICEHCGVLTSTKKKKGDSHLPGCPALSVRKDLTLEEKVQVVQALEQPGVKMVTLAKKYGVSASAISRIHKNRVDILARRASGLANAARRRDRSSKEPEVEKLLCEWFKVQLQLGIHISGSMIREKAKEIAKVLGKEFWPSESWVFRWRHRNNVTDINTFLYADGDESERGGLGRNNEHAEDVTLSNSSEVLEGKRREGDGEATSTGQVPQMTVKKKTSPVSESSSVKQFRLPLSVMCDKCGYVSYRVKNNRIKSLRHAKGCPDLKQRNEHTYENRARMLKALEEPGATLSSVARQFGVSVSSMSRMNQKKDQIFLHSEDHATQKRIRDCKEPEVAYTLYQWYMQKKATGIHVTGPKLKEKAKKIAADFGREFNASSGWLGRWRHRYNIISGVRSLHYLPKNSLKKKKMKRENECKMDNSCEDLAQLQGIPHVFHQNNVGSSESAMVESLQQGPPPQLPQTPVFIQQRFQNPWEIAQQQADSCVWAKEFLTTAGSGVVDESTVAMAYTYGDTVPKPVFHNMLDSFSAVGYPVALPLDSGVVLSREYLKPDIIEDKCGPSGTLLPHVSHSSHGQLSHHLTSNIQHNHQHQMQLPHPQSLPQPQPSHAQPHPQMNFSLPSASPVTLDDDPEQQRQVMEALKIMSSFAQKKCLGDQVQAALRTIEMSMKGSPRKTSTRHTYTAI